MEKRALMAFLLSLLLFFAYEFFFVSKSRKEIQPAGGPQIEQPETVGTATLPPRQAASREAQPAAPERAMAVEKTERHPAAWTPAEASTGENGDVIVATPLYEITLSKAGAEVTSVRLLHYTTAGEPVQLIQFRPDSLPRGAVSVAIADDEVGISLSRALFDAYRQGGRDPLPDGTVITLGERERQATLVFRAVDAAGRSIERYYVFSADDYFIETGVRFSTEAFSFAREIVWGLGAGLRSTETHKEDDYMAFQTNVRLGDEYHRHKRGDFGTRYSGTVQWAAIQTKYFTAILLPKEPTAGEVIVAGERATNTLTASVGLPVVEKQGRIDQAIELYFGPLDYGVLKSLGRGLEKNIDMGFKLFRPVSSGILWSMIALYKVIPNYGVVIILLSIFTKVLFYRLTHKSFKSMRDMQALQPKMQALKEKYKDDRQKLSAETMKLYKEHGVNPLGGCLPLLLQMPVFIALFSVLKFTIELRGAHFVGWINDLSQPDVLFLLPVSLPFLGDAFSVLPILMGAAMIVQSKIGGSITGTTPNPAQSKAMTYLMPIVFTAIFYRMPSGLVLYWLVNNILSIAQQYYINKDSTQKEEVVDAKEETSRSKKTPKERKAKVKVKER